MLDFKNKLEKAIVNYFIKYNVNPNPINNEKVIDFDAKNQIHHTNSINSKSNLNIAVSQHLLTQEQSNKASEIIKSYQKNKIPFTWVIISHDQDLKEKAFFETNGFILEETIITMIIDLNQFQSDIEMNENEKFEQVQTLADIENFRKIIENSFPLTLIDLEKYYGLFDMRKNQKVDYLVYLKVDGQPTSTGNFYVEDDIVIIDDIATDPNFQRHGYGKKMLHHLLSTAKSSGYQQAVLIATPDGFPLYQKLGFKAIDLYFDVYIVNY